MSVERYEGTEEVDLPFVERDYDGRIDIVLPHKCGEWTIGAAEHVQALIRDLKLAVARMKHGTIDVDWFGGAEGRPGTFETKQLKP